MPQIGSFTLLLALSLAVYSFAAGALALYRKDDRLGETARRAGIACWAAVTIASMALVLAAFGNDFSVAYILHHSNRDLPIAYKFAALWSGQEGSLLLWAWLLSTYGLVMRLRYKVDPQLTAYASAIVAAVQVFFLLLVNFAAHPFGLVPPPPLPLCDPPPPEDLAAGAEWEASERLLCPRWLDAFASKLPRLPPNAELPVRSGARGGAGAGCSGRAAVG